MEETLLPVGTSYTEVYASFCWQLPTTFNIGVDVCDRHADDPSRLAMVYEDDTVQVSTHTFAEFRARSNQLAHALIKLGITRGDRVGIILSQRPEAAVAAVVGSPDAVRGEVVKAFVQLRAGILPTPAQARELAEYVRTRLSAHEYPRAIEFIEALPVTTTGKVRRRDLRELERHRKIAEQV